MPKKTRVDFTAIAGPGVIRVIGQKARVRVDWI